MLFLPDPGGSPPASSGCSLVLAARPRSSPELSRTPWCRGGQASNGRICSKLQEKQGERWRNKREGGGYKEPAHLKQLSNQLNRVVEVSKCFTLF